MQLSISKLTIEGRKLNGVGLADAFNNFFTNMSTLGSPTDACQYMNMTNDKTLFMPPVTAQEVI